jgi:hypothetical protein
MKDLKTFILSVVEGLLILFILSLIVRCSKSTEPPPINNGPDTTSHNFVWQIDSFRTNQFNANIFWDIHAVSEDNVWAVGDIAVDSTDSSGAYVTPYNAAHWDGSKWTLKRIWVKYDHNPAFVRSFRTIWYFSDNSIIIGRGSLYHYKGGVAQLTYDAWTYGSVYHLWAASENEIYGVGDDGVIVRYNGSNWSKMESGTTMDFQDIWGTVDEESGQVEVWAVGYDLSSERHGIILKYDGTEWKTVFDKNNNIYEPDWDHTVPTALWGFKDSLYVSLSGAEDSDFMQHSREDFQTQFRFMHNEDQGAIQAIHGNSFNDFFAAGHSDVVLHYNGNSYKSFYKFKYLDGNYHGVQQVNNEVFICGKRFGYNTALLLHGTRFQIN